MDEEKKFIVPEAEIVDYSNDDIITMSGVGLAGVDDWRNDDNWETW